MINFIKMFISVSLFGNMFFPPVSAQSIASSLAKYQKKFGEDISGISATSISGIAFHPTSKTLYVVDDANTTVYEISMTGSLIRSITLSGFTDTEGIAYQSGDYFFIVEEGLANLLRVEIPQTGSGPVNWDSCVVLSIASDWGNTGLEDVSYLASTNTVYAVKEVDPPRLYRIILDKNGDPVDFFENDPFNIEESSGDAAGICALSDGNFLILNQKENKLIGYSGTGENLSELSLEDMTKPEGVTIDTSDSSIYVVGEPRQLFLFENSETTIRSHSLTTPSLALSHNHYNLFSRTIILQYHLSSAVNVLLEIFNIKGKRINVLVNKEMTAGTYRAIWNARGYPAGVYVFSFKAGLFNETIEEVLF